MNYKYFENAEAKSFAMKIALHNKSDKLLSVYILQFIGESNDVLMYVSYADNFEIANIKTFVLISKCDFDPLKQHNNPYTLNFIYTPRRAGPLICILQNNIPQHAERLLLFFAELYPATCGKIAAPIQQDSASAARGPIGLLFFAE